MAASSCPVDRKLLRRICFSVSERGEEAFDLVKPTGRGGREVDMGARMADHPALDGGGLVGGVVVHHQMHVARPPNRVTHQIGIPRKVRLPASGYGRRYVCIPSRLASLFFSLWI